MPGALPPLSYVFMAQCLIKYTYNLTVLYDILCVELRHRCNFKICIMIIIVPV